MKLEDINSPINTLDNRYLHVRIVTLHHRNAVLCLSLKIYFISSFIINIFTT